MMSWFPIFGAGFLVGYWICAATWLLSDRKPSDRDPDWRRSFSHENTNRPPSDPPLKFRRRSAGRQRQEAQ
jgi:hypothetical protein